METASLEKTYSRNRIHPQKFGLFLACASIVMMFAGLTSAYLVRQAAGNWLEFKLPGLFAANTAVILLSSLVLHFSYNAYIKGNSERYKLFVLLALILGIAFLVLQYLGWQELYSIGVSLEINPSASFIYVISGLHAAHVLGGIAALTMAVLHAYSLPYKVTAPRKLRFELTLIYWHFVDLLWVYLFVFFISQQH